MVAGLPVGERDVTNATGRFFEATLEDSLLDIENSLMYCWERNGAESFDVNPNDGWGNDNSLPHSYSKELAQFGVQGVIQALEELISEFEAQKGGA